MGCAPMSGYTQRRTFDCGQTVSGTRSRQALDECVVFQAAHAMIDACDIERVERPDDVRGWPFLAGMRGKEIALSLRLCVRPCELLRRIAALSAVEADGVDAIAPWTCHLQRLQCRRLVEMAQKTHDQTNGNAPLRSRLVDRREQSFHHDIERNAPIRMRLRIEHHLQVDDVLFAAASEIGRRERLEILHLAKRRRAEIVEIQKTLEVVEVIGREHFVERAVSSTLGRSARASISAGSSVPSMCRCSSAFGTSAKNFSAFPSMTS